MMDLFSFCLLKMLTDRLEWCGLLVDYCDVFISCLDSHSDGTHSLQRIHCWDTDGILHFSKSDEETNSFISQLSTFAANFHFWVNYSFKVHFRPKISNSLQSFHCILSTKTYHSGLLNYSCNSSNRTKITIFQFKHHILNTNNKKQVHVSLKSIWWCHETRLEL